MKYSSILKLTPAKLSMAFLSLITACGMNTCYAGEKFNGPSFGLLGGYGFGSVKGEERDPTGVPNGWLDSNKPEGFVYGVGAGFNFNVSEKIIFGIAVDALKSQIRDKDEGAVGAGWPTENIFKWITSEQIKLGYIYGNYHIYTTAGLAQSRIKSNLYSTWTTIVDSQTDLKSGYVFGFGAERAISNKITAKAEYRRYNFGALNITATNYTGAGYYEHVNARQNLILVGLSYRLD